MSVCTDIPLVLSLLDPYLPWALPLYRRIQFHSTHPKAPHACILTSPPTSNISHSPPRSSRSDLANSSIPPFTVAHIDLSRGPETQIWMFSTLEVPVPPSASQVASHTKEFNATINAQFLDIMRTCYRDLVSLMSGTPPLSYTANEKAQKRYGKMDYSPSRVLFGTLHKDLRNLIPDHAIRRVDAPYLKYIFEEGGAHSPGDDTLENDALPHGYVYGELSEQDLRRALDRTDIPRSVETLRTLYGRGVFTLNASGERGKDAIAWGFLGVDGSLSSLHTEVEHRGRGLGVRLSRHLFGKQRQVFGNGGGQWGHADVAEDNAGSRRVMEKVGGQVMWRNGWVEIELEDYLGYSSTAEKHTT
ncbi:MAG: hypothetical protein Q9227_009486 [Pyrenula ochraceoflavens]